MLTIGEHAFMDVCDFPLRCKVIEKLCVAHGGIQDVALDDVFDGSHGVHSEKCRRHMEGVGVEEDAFAGFFLWNGPFFGRKSLRGVRIVDMVKIVDTASAKGVVWMAFQQVELLL